ncbi:unnamed protein product [Staurois parvus]|uniref:Uncharacterized protein n=1 Tax=Staurois parvus TaxID=386267 RepID=A0ABN9G2W9_9NEOB|nr:unnamed protein product [Staurois parvus]
MSPSSVFPGFHTGRSHHPSPHHQSGILGDYNIIVKEEYKEEDEEYGVMEEFSEGHKDMMEPSNTRNPPERCPRSLYSRDSTQEEVTPSLTITRLMDPVMGTHQRDVPVLCIPGIPHRKVTPSLTIIR